MAYAINWASDAPGMTAADCPDRNTRIGATERWRTVVVETCAARGLYFVSAKWID